MLRWVCEYTDRSAPFGNYCLSRPLAFSLVDEVFLLLVGEADAEALIIEIYDVQ